MCLAVVAWFVKASVFHSVYSLLMLNDLPYPTQGNNNSVWPIENFAIKNLQVGCLGGGEGVEHPFFAMWRM